jgi:tetratricopeptide (TPR) repeat protein
VAARSCGLCASELLAVDTLVPFFAVQIEARPITPSDQARLESALAAYNAGDPQKAEPVLRELATSYPDNFELIETLGLIYGERGELSRAIPLLEAGFMVNAFSPEAAANLGTAYLKANRIPDAVRLLGRAAALDPKNAQTQSSYGHALMLAQRAHEAATAFAAADTADPGKADNLYNWALAESDSGNLKQAAALLDRIPGASQSAEMESLCGEVEEKLGHFDRALACFQSAAKLEPSELNVNALGLELLKHWSFAPATKIYEYGVSKFPPSARLQAGLGISLYADGKYDRAAQVFSRLLRVAPNQPSYAKYLGQSCVALEAGAEEECSTLIHYACLHKTDAAAARLAASFILTRHDSARLPLAGQFLQTVISLDPQSAEAYYELGVLKQQQGQWQESLAMLKKSDGLRHGSSKTHLKLALAYSHLGQPEHAHAEAALQKQLRQAEDADMEARRSALSTFLLEMR